MELRNRNGADKLCVSIRLIHPWTLLGWLWLHLDQFTSNGYASKVITNKHL